MEPDSPRPDTGAAFPSSPNCMHILIVNMDYKSYTWIIPLNWWSPTDLGKGRAEIVMDSLNIYLPPMSRLSGFWRALSYGMKHLHMQLSWQRTFKWIASFTCSLIVSNIIVFVDQWRGLLFRILSFTWTEILTGPEMSAFTWLPQLAHRFTSTTHVHVCAHTHITHTHTHTHTHSVHATM